MINIFLYIYSFFSSNAIEEPFLVSQKNLLVNSS